MPADHAALPAYPRDHEHRMGYPPYWGHGWPVGSGPVEPVIAVVSVPDYWSGDDFPASNHSRLNFARAKVLTTAGFPLVTPLSYRQ